MKLSIDDLLTDADVSAICVAEDHPLSLDRVMQRTISKASGYAPARRRKRLSLPLIAAVIAVLLAATVFAISTSGYTLYTVDIEYAVNENGQIIRPEEPEEHDLGITLSVSGVSPSGLNLAYFLNKASESEVSIITSYYFLDKQTKNDWEVVPARNTELLKESWLKVSDAPHTIHVDWSITHGELAPGTYRIRQAFEFAKINGTFSVYFIDAEFVIAG